MQAALKKDHTSSNGTSQGTYRQESPADTFGEHRGETQDVCKLWLLATWTASF